MTPKEKAQELWLSYYELIDDCYSSKAAKGIAKQFALIAVNEILNNFGLISESYIFYTNSDTRSFYEEVKQETEKL
jgi:hypothetical protein